METGILKDMIAVIRAEEQRRGTLRRDTQLTVEDANFAYDQWLFTDAPFVNELCLMLLVTLRHQVEKELVGLAARAADDGKEISGLKYDQEVRNLRKGNGWDWKTMNARLSLESCEGHTFMEALRHLANSYKHDPSKEPGEKLLKLLKLETEVSYLPLPKSDSLSEGLAAYIGLRKDAAWSDIAERFVDVAGGFLVDVQSRTELSRVKRGRTSLDPNHAAR